MRFGPETPDRGTLMQIQQKSVFKESRAYGGFTLIELVISTALMAMILGGAYACMRAAIDSDKAIHTRAEITQNARVALALMVADLRCAAPLSKDIELLGLSRTLGDIEADNIDFGSHHYSPRAPYEGDFCEVSYFIDRNRETGKLSLWRRRDSSPDPEPLQGGSREEIAEGLAGLRLEYYDGFEWYDEWGNPDGKPRDQNASLYAGNLTGLPEAIRVTLLFDGDPNRNPSGITNAAPPAVFQTVVRLDFAAVPTSANASGSSSATNSPAAAPSDPSQPPNPPN